MKSFLLFILFLFNCQVSWYHTRVSPNKTAEIPLSEGENILAEAGTSCFFSILKFQESVSSNDFTQGNLPLIDTQFIENIRTNLKLKIQIQDISNKFMEFLNHGLISKS